MSYFYTKPFFCEESLLFSTPVLLPTSLEDLKLCFTNRPFYCVSQLVYNLNHIAKAGKLFSTSSLSSRPPPAPAALFALICRASSRRLSSTVALRKLIRSPSQP